MKILVTGARGYIGGQLIPRLLKAGHEVVASKGDLLKPETLDFPEDIDAAYYLVHSMKRKAKGFYEMEAACARNFNKAIAKTAARQVIYLSGLAKNPKSEHMLSRQNVEKILGEGVPLTVLRAGIVMGSGSASFEILKDLVEKLPVMIGPKWVHSRCQPIAIDDVLFYLGAVLGKPGRFDIGGPDILTYKEMLLLFAKVRGLKRWIITVPVLTPRLSSLWLYFVTKTNFALARALVDSLTTDAICQEQKELPPHECMGFEEALKNSE